MSDQSDNFDTPAKRVLLAHPHALTREGVSRILKDGGFEVTGEVGVGGTTCQLMEELAPDLILVDWDLPDVDWAAIAKIACGSGIAVVVLASPEASVSLLPGLRGVARGYLSTDISSTEFVQAVHMVSTGSVVLSQTMTEALMGSFGLGPSPKDDKLSEREREVLALVAQGASNREIADQLIVSENTVKVHLRSILNKLNLRNRQQVAAYAVREGLIAESRVEGEPVSA